MSITTSCGPGSRRSKENGARASCACCAAKPLVAIMFESPSWGGVGVGTNQLIVGVERAHSAQNIGRDAMVARETTQAHHDGSRTARANVAHRLRPDKGHSRPRLSRAHARRTQHVD